MVVQTRAQSSKLALIAKERDARRTQAQFTHFQMAIGLRKSLEGTALRNLVYGTSLEAIDVSNPTRIDMKDDVTFLSLDTKSTFEKDELVAFAWSGCSLDATGLRDVSPQLYDEKVCGLSIFGKSLSGTSGRLLREAIIASMHHEIPNIFHPLCKHSCGTATQHDRKNGRTGHGAYKPRKKTFLLLPDTKRCLHDFEDIGCFLSNHNVIEVIDLRELFQAWTVRKNYDCQSPMTRSRRTALCYELKDLSHHSEILSALGHHEDTTSTNQLGCLSTLRAAVEMAKSDACSPSWLRSLEQVEGGAYSGISGNSTKAYAANMASLTPAEDKALIRELCTLYHRDQFAFEKCLLREFRDHVSSEHKSHFESLFDMRFADSVQPHRHRLINNNHSEVFEIVSKIQGKTVSFAAAKLLRKTIDNREKAGRHFQSLPGREKEKENH